jgi:hypothetical protein
MRDGNLEGGGYARRRVSTRAEEAAEEGRGEAFSVGKEFGRRKDIFGSVGGEQDWDFRPDDEHLAVAGLVKFQFRVSRRLSLG